MDAALIRRLEAVVDSFSLARLESLTETENEFDLRLERFGDSVAPAAPAAPDLDFVNRITLQASDVGRLDEMLGFYRDLGLRPWLEPPPDLEVALPHGLEVLGTQAVLYATPTLAEVDGPAVREVEPDEERARLLLTAFGAPASAVESNARPLVVAAERLDGRFYVVELDGQPSAAAVLTLLGNDAYLAMAGTLPGFRGRGCQAALIHARIAAAAAARCELVVATAAFPSTSHRNLERCGLRTAYTKPVLRLGVPASS